MICRKADFNILLLCLHFTLELSLEALLDDCFWVVNSSHILLFPLIDQKVPISSPTHVGEGVEGSVFIYAWLSAL